MTGYALSHLLPATLGARAPYFRLLIIGVLLVGILLSRPQGILGEERQVSRMM